MKLAYYRDIEKSAVTNLPNCVFANGGISRQGNNHAHLRESDPVDSWNIQCQNWKTLTGIEEIICLVILYSIITNNFSFIYSMIVLVYVIIFSHEGSGANVLMC